MHEYPKIYQPTEAEIQAIKYILTSSLPKLKGDLAELEKAKIVSRKALDTLFTI
jgi:hypothetical protein